jgi:hypothetical protein
MLREGYGFFYLLLYLFILQSAWTILDLSLVVNETNHKVSGEVNVLYRQQRTRCSSLHKLPMKSSICSGQRRRPCRLKEYRVVEAETERTSLE